MTTTYFSLLEPFLTQPMAELYDADGGKLVRLDAIEPDSELVLFAPGTEIKISHVSLPASSEAEARRAAPFAVEDDLAEPVDTLHIALGEKPAALSDPRELHILSAQIMQNWSDAIKARYAGPVTLVAEHAVLPEASAIDIGPRILMNIGGKAASYDKTLPQEILRSLASGQGLKLYKPSMPVLSLARMYADKPALVNLMQGSYKSTRRLPKLDLGQWVRSGGLAAVFVMALIVHYGFEIIAANRAISTFETEMQALVAPIFPDRSQISNPARAVSHALADAETGPRLSFLDASAALYNALEDVPGAQLQSLRFEPDRTGFVARIAYPDYGDDTALKGHLEAFGMAAYVGDARQVNDYVVGEVTLEAGSS